MKQRSVHLTQAGSLRLHFEFNYENYTDQLENGVVPKMKYTDIFSIYLM